MRMANITDSISKTDTSIINEMISMMSDMLEKRKINYLVKYWMTM